jgi:O-acetyl-ADP-ribose deacetylase (regulator of RNase III)
VLKIQKGDFLQAPEDLLVHQCNCVSKTAEGLAADVFRTFPESNVYATRTEPSVPGTIVKCGHIVNLFGQYKPGPPSEKELGIQRLQWFHQGLLKLQDLSKEYHTVAFPFGIGCGLAGGQWKAYCKLLREFARTSGFTRVVLYQNKKN